MWHLAIGRRSGPFTSFLVGKNGWKGLREVLIAYIHGFLPAKPLPRVRIVLEATSSHVSRRGCTPSESELYFAALFCELSASQ